MNYKRSQYKNVEKLATAGMILVIYGPRQVGKTTLLREYFDNFKEEKTWLQGDDIILKKELESRTIGRVSPIVLSSKLVIIDEAQYLEDVGMVLKFLVDAYPDKIFIVTGSSAFGLLHHTREPLTGRANYLNLYPLDIGEIDKNYGRVYTLGYLENILVYGSYPAVVKEGDKNNKENIIRGLTNSYMYKDILEYEGIRNHNGVRDILKMLALQIGHDVSINEIATRVRLSRATVEHYIQVLEKSFILASSQSVNTMNERNEISKNKRYYFVDLGIRNALVGNFAPTDTRSDIGEIWENFVFMERLKKYRHDNQSVDMCFWRTYDGKEVDILEKKNTFISAIECKWSEGKIKISLLEAFTKRFEGLELKVVNRENWSEFLL